MKRTKVAPNVLPSQFVPKVPTYSMKATPAAPTFEDEPKMPSTSLFNPLNQGQAHMNEKDIRNAALQGTQAQQALQLGKKPVTATLGIGVSTNKVLMDGPLVKPTPIAGQPAPEKTGQRGHKELGQFDGNGGYQPIKLPFVKHEAYAELSGAQPDLKKVESLAASLAIQPLARRMSRKDSMLSQNLKEQAKRSGESIVG